MMFLKTAFVLFVFSIGTFTIAQQPASQSQATASQRFLNMKMKRWRKHRRSSRITRSQSMASR